MTSSAAHMAGGDRSSTTPLIPRATYLLGSRGVEYRRNDATGQTMWYLYDGLGSVLAEIDPLGNMTTPRKYDVYGLVRASSGTSTSRHKFVGSLGHTSEDETGLIYMRARWMDPSLGRFISEDPARDGANWFEYCRGNPVNLVDEDGRAPVESWCLYWAGVTTAALAVLLYYHAVQAKCTPMAALALMYAVTAVGMFMGALEGSGAPAGVRGFSGWVGLALGGAAANQVYSILIAATLDGMSKLGTITFGVGATATGAMAGYTFMVIAALILTEI